MQKISVKLILTLSILWLSYTVCANNVIDSLNNILINTTVVDSVKMRIYVEIGEEYFGHDNVKALEFYEKAYTISVLEINELYEAKIYSKKGDVFQLMGNHTKALDCFYKSLNIYKKTGDNYNIAICLIEIGICNNKLTSNLRALKYYGEAIEIGEELENKFVLAFAYNNLANTQESIGQIDQALENYFKSLKLYEELKRKDKQAGVIANIGLVYSTQGKFNDAIKYLTNSIELYKFFNNREAEADLMAYLAKNNLLMGDAAKREVDKRKSYNFAILQAEKSLRIAREINIVPYQISAYEILFKANIKIGMGTKALFYFDKYKVLKDSLTASQRASDIRDVETNHEVEKKVAENNALKEQELINNKVIRIQYILGVFIGTGLLLLIALAIILLKQNNKKKKANIILKKQYTEINQQKEEIKTQTESLTLANSSIKKQKEKIELIHKRTIDSITYAERIQRAMLPSDEKISQIFSNYFILFKPRDIVSGDFYWIKQINIKEDNIDKKIVIVAIVDSTGHGVPGGFMSTLGISLLNEIVSNNEVRKASEILEQLRKEVKILLKQTDDIHGQKDSMDLALCAINTETYELSFSGANNSLYIIRPPEHKEDLYSNNEKIDFTFGSETEGRGFEIVPDYQPVGIYFVEKPFTNHKMQLQDNDSIYMFSDGYVDQFRGKKRRKFKTKRLQQLLIDIHQESMDNQKAILDKTIMDWKGSFRQIDDIILMGIKI